MVADTLPTALVSAADIRAHLGLPDTTQDDELDGFASAMTPVVELICGAVLPVTYTEYYAGGGASLSLRHRPVLDVEVVTEYWGSSAYVLTSVGDPSLGTTYSYIFDPPNQITRRTSGGGVRSFPSGPQSVKVTYRAGRATVPKNIRLGTLELIRVNFQQTQQGGPAPFNASGLGPSGDDYSGTQVLGFFVPNRVREMLIPSRRHPSVA